MKEVDIDLIGLVIERRRELNLVIIEVSLFNDEGKRCGAQYRSDLTRFEEETDPFISPAFAQSLSRQMVGSIKRYLEKRGVVMSNEAHVHDEITRAMLLINGDFLRYDFRTQELELFQGTRIETIKK